MLTTDIYAGIYVNNVQKTSAFFQRLFGGTTRQLQPDMVEVNVGTGRLILNQRSMMADSQAHDGPGSSFNSDSKKELELGIWVDDIHDVHQSLAQLARDEASDIRFVSPIAKRPGDISDFRFRLAEGYYIRVAGDSAAS